MDDKQRAIITSASQDSSVGYIVKDDKVTPVITNDWSFIADLNQIVSVVKYVIKTDDILFQVKLDSYTKRKYVHATSLGKSVIGMLRIDTDNIKVNFQKHHFSPHVQLFMSLVEAFHLDEFPPIIKALSGTEVDHCVNYLNESISELREQGRSEKFKSQIDARERSGNKNYAGLIKYLDAHFAACSRLLVIRLDLGYRKAYSWPVNVESQVEYGDVKQHWKMMLHYLRNKLPGNCFLGFAWKLEYGAEKGFHYHLLLLLNGAKVQEDVTIACLIGEYWSDVITSSKGLYFNCNRMKAKYKSCGIGMINHYDTELRKALEDAALYLTKTDYHIGLVAPGKDRTFGKGNMPKPKSSKRGRPRKVVLPLLYS